MSVARSPSAYVPSASSGGRNVVASTSWETLSEGPGERDPSIPADEDTGLEVVHVHACNVDSTFADHHAFVGVGSTDLADTLVLLVLAYDGLQPVTGPRGIRVARGLPIYVKADANSVVNFRLTREPWFAPKP